MVHWLSSPIFPFLFVRLSVPLWWHPTKSPLFSICTGIKALYWPSFTKYQAVSSYTDPALPSTNQYRTILTQHHQLLTSAALYWPCTIIYQPVLLHSDPVPSSTNQYRPLLTQYYQVPTSIALYWVSITDPVTPSTNSYRPMLTHILKQSLVIWSDLGMFWGSLGFFKSALDWWRVIGVRISTSSMVSLISVRFSTMSVWSSN